MRIGVAKYPLLGMHESRRWLAAIRDLVAPAIWHDPSLHLVDAALQGFGYTRSKQANRKTREPRSLTARVDAEFRAREKDQAGVRTVVRQRIRGFQVVGSHGDHAELRCTRHSSGFAVGQQ